MLAGMAVIEGGDDEVVLEISCCGCGCLVPGSVPGPVGWGLEQRALVEGVPCHGEGWKSMVFKVPSDPGHSGILC